MGLIEMTSRAIDDRAHLPKFAEYYEDGKRKPARLQTRPKNEATLEQFGED